MAAAAVQCATCSSLLDRSQPPSMNAGAGTAISHSIFGAQLQQRIHLIYSALMSKKDLFQRGEIRFKLFICILEKKRTNECDCAGFRNYKTEFWLVLSAIRCLFIFINFAVVHPVLLSSLNPLHSSSFFILSSSFSPDSISSLSSLRIPSSLPSRFLSRSNSVHLCVHTPGCCGNGGRPHKRVDEQKTRRPSSTEMERGRRREAKSNFICMYIFFRRGGLVCVRKMRG